MDITLSYVAGRNVHVVGSAGARLGNNSNFLQFSFLSKSIELKEQVVIFARD